MSFQKRLYGLRKQKGLSQDELGGELGVSRQTISKWESGETTPEMEKLVKISDYFGVSLDSLVKDTTAPEPPAQSDDGDDDNSHRPRTKTPSKFWRRLLMALLVIIAV